MHALRLAFLGFLCSCSLSPDLPLQPPALADMEEPLDLRAEPDDEAQRQKLPIGTFSGLYVDDARDTLADKLDQPSQLRIAQVIENSPAAAAGLQPDDLLLEVKVGDRVLFGKYTGAETTVDGEERLFIREDDVLGIFER